MITKRNNNGQDNNCNELKDLAKNLGGEHGISRPSAFVKFCYRDDAIKAYLELRSVHKWTADWYAINKSRFIEIGLSDSSAIIMSRKWFQRPSL